MRRAVFVAIFEAGVIGGCVLAFFLVPPTTPIRTFLIICASCFALANVLLFIRLRKPASSVTPEPKADNSKAYIAGSLGLLLIIWQLYERYGR